MIKMKCYKFIIFVFILVILSIVAISNVYSDNNTIVFEDGFEKGLEGWLFHSAGSSGEPIIETTGVKEGKQSIAFDTLDPNGWEMQTNDYFTVKKGEIYEIELWIKLSGDTNAAIFFQTFDEEKKPVSESKSEAWLNKSTARDQWLYVKTTYIVEDGVSFLNAKMYGWEKGKITIDHFTLKKIGFYTKEDYPKVVQLSNAFLDVEFDTGSLLFKVTDKRNQAIWEQKQVSAADMIFVKKLNSTNDSINMELFLARYNLIFSAAVKLAADKPELSIALSGSDGIPSDFVFPQPFMTGKGTDLIIPIQNGMSLPVEDTSVDSKVCGEYPLYCGNYLSMKFFGATDGKKGYMTIIDTPDDAQINVIRNAENLCAFTKWKQQKGKLGYERKLKQVFFDKGGFVAMAKRYREEAKSDGIFKTLIEKKKENANVDKLVGAAFIVNWNWDEDLPFNLYKSGMKRFIWSTNTPNQIIGKLNKLNLLTCNFDNYLDVRRPGMEPLFGNNLDAAWPNEVLLDSRGNWVKGWPCLQKNGQTLYAAALCDVFALKYAKKTVKTRIDKMGFQANFVDTAAATEFRECYDAKHPTTRTQDKELRMNLLKYFSKDRKLVVGSESGIDSAVPYSHFFGGMMGICLSDEGAQGVSMPGKIKVSQPIVDKFQTGQKYRIPLWELVFHDCTVSYWGGGNGSDKFIDLWRKFDLFNVLYGTPPVYCFDPDYWKMNKKKYIDSYNVTTSVARAAGYSEMTDFQYLTPNRDVQMTTFANGIKVIVNFGGKPYKSSDGAVINGMNYKVYGMK